MFAARDQENLVHGHQQVAASKPLNQTTRGLQPKTPGNRYPKTPLKVPLHDENAPTGFGGKSGKGKGMENQLTGKKGANLDKSAFVTPMGPRTRAPLGMKTTNAKTKAAQTPAGPPPEKELDKTQQPPKTSARRPKKVVHADTVKLQIHGDESPLAEREVEYAPPRPKDLPYESDVFPNGCLNYDVLKPKNLMRGVHQTYHGGVDKNGLTKLEREYEEEYKKSAKQTDDKILRMMEEDWTVGDVPETFKHQREKLERKYVAPVKKEMIAPSKGPATITSRRAASALADGPKPSLAPRKASSPATKPTRSFLGRTQAPKALLTSNTSAVSHGAAAAASRSTIGYSKGRSAISGMQKREGGLARSVSSMSQGSDTTITPARFASQEHDDGRRLDFLRAFDIDDDDLEPGLGGAFPESLREEEDEEDFVLKLCS